MGRSSNQPYESSVPRGDVLPRPRPAVQQAARRQRRPKMRALRSYAAAILAALPPCKVAKQLRRAVQRGRLVLLRQVAGRAAAEAKARGLTITGQYTTFTGLAGPFGQVTSAAASMEASVAEGEAV